MTKNQKMLLKSKPFISDVNGKSFYHYPALKQRHTLLMRLFAGESRLIFIIGDPGSGKTLFLKQFLANDEKNWRKCKIHPGDSGETSGGQHEYPAFINTKHGLPVIVIDNAHNLNASELMFFIKMVGGGGQPRRLRQILFFGEPAILQVMARHENELPDDATMEKIHMPTLSQKETNEYISRRLCSTGYTGAMPFTQADINRIFQNSGGNPGSININASIALEKKLQSRGKVTSFFKTMLKNSDE